MLKREREKMKYVIAVWTVDMWPVEVGSVVGYGCFPSHWT